MTEALSAKGTDPLEMVANPALEPRAEQLVLASSSPRRRDLLAQSGYCARVVPATIDESNDPWLSVRELVMLNAGRKARQVSHQLPASVVLGVDTLVSLEGKPLGKPANYVAAAAMLASLAGREHEVLSGVCLVRLQPSQAVCVVSATRVLFRPLSPEDIAAYLQLINPLDKAGGYAAQEHGERIIASTTGSWTNVMGLPMELLAVVLEQKFGIRPGAPLL